MFLSLHTDAVLILREDSALAAVVGVFAKIICVGSLSFFASAYYTVDKASTTFWWWIGVMIEVATCVKVPISKHLLLC